MRQDGVPPNWFFSWRDAALPPGRYSRPRRDPARSTANASGPRQQPALVFHGVPFRSREAVGSERAAVTLGLRTSRGECPRDHPRRPAPPHR